MRKILLPTLLLLATAAVGGTTYTVAHSGRDHARHDAAGDRGGRSAGHVQAQPVKLQSGRGRTDGPLHTRRLTLVSSGAERDSLPDLSDGNRHDHDRLDDQSPSDGYDFNGAGRTSGSTDAGPPGASDDGGWGNRFASFGSPAQGPGGFGGLSQKPGQGSDAPPPGDRPTGDQNGSPQAIVPQSLSKSLAILPVAGVPEPSTWMMMLIGVGALGAVLRRGRGRGTVRPVGAASL